MSNPPPYPSGTLTAKFAALSADVAAYIEAIDLKLAQLSAEQTIANTALSTIIGALAALSPIIQQAADCSCAAAAALEDAPWNIGDPTDPEADPDTLDFACQDLSGAAWVPEAGGGTTHILNWAGAANLPGVEADLLTNNVTLTGPLWFKVTVDNPNLDLVGVTANGVTLTIFANFGEIIEQAFFVPTTATLIAQVEGAGAPGTARVQLCAAGEAGPPPPPPPPPACDDLEADPELLNFNEYIGFGLNFWGDEANSGFADFTNLVPGFTADDGGQTLILTGPSWYRFEFNKVGDGGSINYFGSGGGDQELSIVVTTNEPTVRYFYVIGPLFGMYANLTFTGVDPAEHDTLRLSTFSIGVCDGGGA